MYNVSRTSLIAISYRRQLRLKHSDPNDRMSLRDRRRPICQAIQALSSPQQVYMPGVATFLDDIDPAIIVDAPETVKLWLPSQLPSYSRDRLCVKDLPHLEFRLRLAQAYDALDLIRHFRGAYQVLLMKNKVHLSNSQGTMTKAKSVFSTFSLKIDQAAARYRDARIALLRLDPNEQFSRWKRDLQELRRDDVRGPSREVNEKSESRQQLSWIWRTASQQNSAGINDPHLRDVMRVEWCKAIARAERFEEEVELLVEEMRRTLVFFKWTADGWERRAGERAAEPKLDGRTVAGIKAYAARQAAFYRKLIDVFIQDWYGCLELKSLGTDWLSQYSRPTTCQRRRLESNVKAYHTSTFVHVDDEDSALVNDPLSDVETSSAGDPSDFFDDL